MEWVRVCKANSLSNGELISFDNNNNKILIVKVQIKSMQLTEYVLTSMLSCQQDS